MDPTALPRRVVVASFAALLALAVLWEMLLAPQRPGGSLLVLKAVPLALALPGLVRGRIRTFQWWSMGVLVYLAEGVVRGMTDADPISRALGWLECALAVIAWTAILATVRAARRVADASPAR